MTGNNVWLMPKKLKKPLLSCIRLFIEPAYTRIDSCYLYESLYH